VLDKKKKIEAWKKKPNRRAVPLQPRNPSAGQPMAIQDRTNKNQKGAISYAFSFSF